MKNDILFKTTAKKFTNHKYVLGTFMGRYALYLALEGININKKDVLVPTFTCDVVINAIKSAGGTPVFIDVNKNNFEMNILNIKNKINKNTRAIIIHNYFGNICKNRNAIIKLAKLKGIVVIDDCAWTPIKENDADIKIYSFAKVSDICGGLLSTNSKKYYLAVKKILINQKSDLSLKIYKSNYLFFINLQHKIDRLKDIPRKHITTRIYSLIYQFLRPILIINKIIGWRLNIKQDYFTLKKYAPKIYWNCNIMKSQKQKAIIIMRDFEKTKNATYKVYNKIEDKINSNNDYIIINIKNIPSLIALAKKEKIYLRQTWPAIQKIEPLQHTQNTEYIKNHVLLFRINHHLKNKDIFKIKNLLRAAKI